MRSQLADTPQRPSGVRATAATVDSCASCAASWVRAARSHTRTWPVRSPDSARVPSAPTATATTGSRWPSRAASSQADSSALARKQGGDVVPEAQRLRRALVPGDEARLAGQLHRGGQVAAGERLPRLLQPLPEGGVAVLDVRDGDRPRHRVGRPPPGGVEAHAVHGSAAGDPHDGGVAHAGRGHDRRLQPHERLEAAAREVPHADAAVEGGGRAPLAVAGDRDRGHCRATGRPARVPAARWRSSTGAPCGPRRRRRARRRPR